MCSLGYYTLNGVWRMEKLADFASASTLEVIAHEE